MLSCVRFSVTAKDLGNSYVRRISQVCSYEKSRRTRIGKPGKCNNNINKRLRYRNRVCNNATVNHSCVLNTWAHLGSFYAINQQRFLSTVIEDEKKTSTVDEIKPCFSNTKSNSTPVNVDEEKGVKIVPGSIDKNTKKIVEGKKKLISVLHEADAVTRTQLVALTTGRVFSNLCIGMQTTMLPAMVTQVGCLGTSGVGFLLGSSALAQMALNLHMGYVTDNVGRRAPMVGGTLLDGMGEMLSAAAKSMPILITGRAVVGAGEAMGWGAVNAYQGDVLQKLPQHRGRLVGLISSIGLAAYSVGPAMGGLLITNFGPYAPFVTSGGLMLTLSFMFSKIPETLPNPVTVQDFIITGAKKGADIKSEKTDESFTTGFQRIITTPYLQSIFALDTFGGISWGMYLTIVPLHCVNHFNVEFDEIGIGLSLAAIAAICGSGFGGWISDKFGRLPIIGSGV